MKTKPKEGQRVWLVCIYEEKPIFQYKVDVNCGQYFEGRGINWKFNCFPSRKEAEEARKKIIRILRGEG